MKFLGLPPPQINTPDLPPPRLAVRTIDAVSFTSALGSITHLFPSSASAATFMPIDESPGDDVYTGTPHSYATPSSDFFPMLRAFSRSRTYLPQRLWNSALDIGRWNSGAVMIFRKNASVDSSTS